MIARANLPIVRRPHAFVRFEDITGADGLISMIGRRCALCGLERISRLDHAGRCVHAEWWHFGIQIVAERIPSCTRDPAKAATTAPPIYSSQNPFESDAAKEQRTVIRRWLRGETEEQGVPLPALLEVAP
jgi:hypothetical protein